MEKVFWSYFVILSNDVPTYIYESLFYLLCLVSVIAIALKGWKKGLLMSSHFALVEYVFLIYCSTVMFREVNEEYEYHFKPFWSYAAYDSVNRPDLLPENIMNVVVFIPLGGLLGAGFRKMKWWMALLIGMDISLSIEMAQYVFKLGFSETDDVIHNSTGCMIGYGLCRLIIKKMRSVERN